LSCRLALSSLPSALVLSSVHSHPHFCSALPRLLPILLLVVAPLRDVGSEELTNEPHLLPALLSVKLLSSAP
jgi:hypothetical protein